MLASKVVFIDLGCVLRTASDARLWESSHTREPTRCESATLIDEHHLGRVHYPGYHHPPGGSQELVAFCSESTPFFLVEFIRFMARHTVERLTSTEATARRYSHLCCRVRKGCSLRSASSSLLARSSILGFEPGLFSGASDRPSSSILA